MRRMTRVSAIVLTFALGFSLMPAGNTAVAKKVTVKKVAVSDSLIYKNNNKAVTVTKGKTVTLAAAVTVTPNKAANKKVTWASKNAKIATVSAKGVVKGIKEGSTTITATSKKDAKKSAAITVKVVKGAVKKVTLDKKTAALNVGDTLTLKAKVKKADKGACKTIGWSSSKKKVATVNKKGVVTAVAAGKAVITAAAADGSGKKASCTVTVTDSVDLTAVKVVDPQTVSFTLSKANALAQTAVTVSKKETYEGQYKCTAVIQGMSSADNKSYTITLDKDYCIGERQYVQVSIPTLSGKVKSLQTQYTEPVSAYVSEVVWTMKTNEYFNSPVWFGDAIGVSDIDVTGLPAGLTVEKKDGTTYIKGIPTATGVTNATAKGVDELGNTLTKTIKCAVGSDEVMAGASVTDYQILGTNVDYSLNRYDYIKQQEGVYKSVFNEGYTKKEIPFYTDDIVDVVGGSGQYEYSIAPNGDPQSIIQYRKDYYGDPVPETDENGNVIAGKYKYDIEEDYGDFGYKVAQPGVYNVTVRVTDQISKKTLDIPVTLNVAAGVTVSGKITDAQGQGMRGARIEFYNKNKAELYPLSEEAYTDVNGDYSVNIYPGTYVVAVSCNTGRYYHVYEAACDDKYMFNQNFTAATPNYNVQLSLYRVHITNINDSYKYTNADGKVIDTPIMNTYPDGSTKQAVKNLKWTIDDQSAGTGEYVYLKPGQYTLTATEKEDEIAKDNKCYDKNSKYTAIVNVVNTAVEVAASVSQEEKFNPTKPAPTPMPTPEPSPSPAPSVAPAN
jgi:hypothetical protein